MPHLDPDRIALIAVGEGTSDDRDLAHLERCAQCRDELTALRQIATRASETQWVHHLPMPPERVWRGILARLSPPQRAAARDSPAGRPLTGQQRGEPAPPAASGRHGHARLRMLVVTVLAALITAAGVLVVTLVPDRQASEQVTAQAQLQPSGQAPAARGQAHLLDDRTLRLQVQDLPAVDGGYHEVWLIDPDTMDMISLGMLGDGLEVRLALPLAIDPETFRLVDISAEPNDGDPTHSGDSRLRGRLGY